MKSPYHRVVLVHITSLPAASITKTSDICLHKICFPDKADATVEDTVTLEEVNVCNGYASSFETIIYSFEVLQISDKNIYSTK
ncbi:hypothetical protein [Chryseobacterium sp. JV274]|uniref:hypothetical protein n=1 Tax=unclassified Chryseobacterium TaxID=2593645 RepID=UPI00111551A8|nr:hypothetical protein [Chryseobacterium sp. JV274]CAD0225018.1 protein of unknown function [Chryseobacterium sp. JV274]